MFGAFVPEYMCVTPFFFCSPVAIVAVLRIVAVLFPSVQTALSDVLLVNLWRSDLGRSVASNVRTVKVCAHACKQDAALPQQCVEKKRTKQKYT